MLVLVVLPERIVKICFFLRIFFSPESTSSLSSVKQEVLRHPLLSCEWMDFLYNQKRSKNCDNLLGCLDRLGVCEHKGRSILSGSFL